MSDLHRFLVILALISLVWVGFLYLVYALGIDSTSALLMVWVSAILILIALFPSVLKRLKNFKLKFGSMEFEIALRKAIEDSGIHDLLSHENLEQALVIEKGGFAQLWNMIKKIDLNKERPVILDVNLAKGRISIPMLYIYLRVLNSLADDVYVLFLNDHEYSKSERRIQVGKVLGVISSKKAVKVIKNRFPELTLSPIQVERPDGASLADMDQRRFEDILQNIYNLNREKLFCREESISRDEQLTVQEVENWLLGSLSKRSISIEINESDLRQLKEASVRNEDLILVVKDQYLDSLVVLCKIYRKISARVLQQMAR